MIFVPLPRCGNIFAEIWNFPCSANIFDMNFEAKKTKATSVVEQ